MIDVISLASRVVEVPAAHAAIVPELNLLDADGGPFRSVRIRSAKEEPPYPFRTQHRGCWFYVDDRDIQSKVFLETMVAAYSSRLGSKQAGDRSQPQVVLPVGGG
jgi:hypothetical protein